MIVWNSLPHPPPAGHHAVAFGNFDGVHLGHRHLLATLRSHADRLGGLAIAVTLDPHPLALLRPERAPQAVDSLRGRLHDLAQAGVDAVLVLRFDASLAAQTAQWFAQTVLFDGLAAGAVVAGHDTRFGHGGLGDAQLLVALAEPRGIVVQTCEPVLWQGEVVSSSRVRRAVAAGDVAAAVHMLGRPWALDGAVVHGDHRGRTISFATANIAAPGQVLPGHGVYAGWLQRGGLPPLQAVANSGTRPTFDGQRVQVEAHCLDFAGDLYGQQVRLELVQRLRGEQKFDGIAALQAQIAADVAAARVILAQC